MCRIRMLREGLRVRSLPCVLLSSVAIDLLCPLLALEQGCGDGHDGLLSMVWLPMWVVLDRLLGTPPFGDAKRPGHHVAVRPLVGGSERRPLMDERHHRAREISKLREQGEMLASVGRRPGLSAERVRQILLHEGQGVPGSVGSECAPGDNVVLSHRT